jgi:hypothetical protein
LSEVPIASIAPEGLATLVERMSGNRHALPEGLQATQAFIRATGLIQEGCQ